MVDATADPNEPALPSKMVPQARALPRRNFVNEMPDKGLFIFIAMFGFGTIFTLKVLSYNPYWVAGWAVVLMLAYGVIAFRIPLVRMRADRLGDNFYYLGFIYTLASLSAALVQLGSDQSRIDDLIGSFGIALISTVVGIAGRVMFVQMRSEIDQIEEETRRDLLQRSQDLKAQLANSLREFEVFQTGVRQASSEIVSGSASLAREQIEKIGVTAEGVANGLGTAFRAAYEVNAQSARAVQESVVRTAQAIEKLVERIDSMELPSERLEAQVSRLTEEINAMIVRVRAVLQVAARNTGRKRRWYHFGRK